MNNSLVSRKGIVLAGGLGSRLFPLTSVVSKQLLPIFDKPLIYYPISTLMLCKIYDILIISDPANLRLIKELLGDGSQFGIKLSYAEQQNPNGISEAYIIAEDFLAGSSSALILGDNIFYGNALYSELASATVGNWIFPYFVADPRSYGVLEFDDQKNIVNIIEKPNKAPSNLAVPGLYFLDGNASRLSKTLSKSSRDELEITDLLKVYLSKGKLSYKQLGRGVAWFDAGSFESLNEASNFVRLIQERTGMLIGSPEEIAIRNGLLTKSSVLEKYRGNRTNSYYKRLEHI